MDGGAPIRIDPAERLDSVSLWLVLGACSPKTRDELVEETNLPAVYPIARVVHRKPLCSIHFMKLLRSTGFWRPFHRKRVAANRRGTIPFKGPGDYDFSARLFNLAQANKFPYGLYPCLFFEFTPCRHQEIFPGKHFALRDRPSAKIFFAP